MFHADEVSLFKRSWEATPNMSIGHILVVWPNVAAREAEKFTVFHLGTMPRTVTRRPVRNEYYEKATGSLCHTPVYPSAMSRWKASGLKES